MANTNTPAVLRGPTQRDWRHPALALLAILLLGGALRLWALGHAPPGLHQDEAANAWNAYCLLKTGRDQHGVSWPIFYIRAFGENRSTLFMYLVIPFQALGGLNVTTTRLPTALLGTLTLALIYYVGARWFGRNTGLIAALLLALNPWHIQQSRWGHEAGIVPFLTFLPLTLLLAANLPFSNDWERRRPRPFLALLAGAVAGIVCYGYPAVRLFLPCFLSAAVLCAPEQWWRCLKTSGGRLAVLALLVGGSLTFGPLLWAHLFDSENMNRRGEMIWVWSPDDPALVRLQKVMERYPPHFGPNFLFLTGDVVNMHSPPDSGQFHLYMIPFMLLGAVALLRQLWRFRCGRRSISVRMLLLWVVLYPVSDLLNTATGPHALRSLPGLGGLVLLGAYGAVCGAAWLRPRIRRLSIAAAAVVVLALNGRFLTIFFGDFDRRPDIYHLFHVDLLEACDWLRPRMTGVDAVFVTNQLVIMPYSVTLVGLEHEPADWFREPRSMSSWAADWEATTHYGKMHFRPTSDAKFAELVKNDTVDHVILLLRPGELKVPLTPVHVIYRPDGQAALLIFETGI